MFISYEDVGRYNNSKSIEPPLLKAPEFKPAIAFKGFLSLSDFELFVASCTSSGNAFFQYIELNHHTF